MSRLARFRAMRTVKTNTLESTAGGKAGGIKVRGQLLEIRPPPGRSGGPLNFTFVVTENGGLDIPAAFKKNKVTGEYTQETYESPLCVPQNGQTMSISLYQQPTDSFEPQIFDMVTVCGVVRNGQWVNCNRVLVTGKWSDAPPQVRNIPTPWDMEKQSLDYRPVPFELQPLNAALTSSKSGDLMFSVFDTNKPNNHWKSDDGQRKMNGPFKRMIWSDDSEREVSIKMDLWDPKANLSQFGLLNLTSWETLGSQFPAHLVGRGVMTLTNKDKKSSSLLANIQQDPMNYAVWGYCSHLELDMHTMVKSTGILVSKSFVQHHFDGELVVDSEDAVNNPLSKSTSDLINLDEWTGALTKVYERPDACYYVIANFASEDDKEKLRELSEDERECALKNEPGAKVTPSYTEGKQYMNIYVHLLEGPLRKGKRERS